LRKEEDNKKEEEVGGIDPMDTSPSETSFFTPRVVMSECHFPLGEIGLGAFTPSKLDKVEVLDS
jgi:hypothetical protein